MRILITGICGFVGSTLARGLVAAGHSIIGIDNLIRPGSQLNAAPLKALGIPITHGDIRIPSDLETLPPVDWIIDCAANASVLAGVDGKTSSRQLVEHNLQGTINLLEFAKLHHAGFILLSTSRVYSIPGLAGLEMEVHNGPDASRFSPDPTQEFPPGITPSGVSESYSTLPPVSLYGSTKVASEHLALEYGATFGFPVWINRCGVMAGAGQFGHPAQGIFAFWIHSFREDKPLKYIGFDGHGRQVRDCLHPRDLLPLLEKQMGGSESRKRKSESRNGAGAGEGEGEGEGVSGEEVGRAANSDQRSVISQSFQLSEFQLSAFPKIVNISGGVTNSMSLAELTAWCQERFPESKTQITSDPVPRAFDIPWMILDPQLAQDTWSWKPQTNVRAVCEEIAAFADKNPDWIALSRA